MAELIKAYTFNFHVFFLMVAFEILWDAARDIINDFRSIYD